MRRLTLLRPPFRARVVAALAFALCGTASHAALDLGAAMQSLDGATVATVVLVPPMAIFSNALNQTGLQTSGCHYTTDDPAAIRGLVAMLKSADVTTNAVYQRPDMREGVYFAMADGSKFSLLFADNSGGKLPVKGIAETTNGGQIQSSSVSAGSTLSTDVRSWARRRGGAGTGTTCDLQSPTAEDPQAPAPVPPPLPR